MMQDIQTAIIQKFPEFSKNQKTLANYILENLETVPLLSVNDLAKKAGVSSATVVRFSRVLGFRGYLDFRNHLSELLKAKLSAVEKYKSTISKRKEYQNSLNKVADQMIDNINYSIRQNDLNEFKQVVTHLRNAETVYCIGMGLSHYMSEIFAYLLKLYLKKAFALPGDSITFAEQIITITPKDLLVAFSFTPYSRQTVEAAQLAQRLEIPVISFTDKKTAPIAQYSRHVLIAKTDNILFTNSIGAISMLMNSLVTEIALSEEEKVLEGLQKIDKYINDPRYFI